MDMATVTEMKRGWGQQQWEMEHGQRWRWQQPQRRILDRDCEGDSNWNGYGEGGGEGWQKNSIKLIMHLSTITLTSINIKQYLSYPNISFVLSSFKVASLMWWNKRSADISSRWSLQRRWAILCITNLCSLWSITWLIWGRRECSIKRQTMHKSLGWGCCIGKADMSISQPLQSTEGGDLYWSVESPCRSTSLGAATSWILDLSAETTLEQVCPSSASSPSQ